MSTVPRSTQRLLTAAITVLLTAGLLSAAHADQPEGTERALAVAAQAPAPAPATLPVDVTSPPPIAGSPQTAQALAPAPAPAPAPAAPAPAAEPAPRHDPPPAPPAPAPGPAPAAPSPAPEPAPRQDPPPAQPAPAPAPAPAETGSDEERIERAYAASVPATWRGAITARFEVIEGSTSWASSTGLISIARDHMASPELLADVITHEFGHLIAFRYGSQAYAGAPPAGWPAPAHRPEEAWADCVQRVFLGRSNPSHGLPPCEGEQLQATHEWLAPGPGAHKRTG